MSKNLKVGDDIGVKYYGEVGNILKITKVTATQYVCDDVRFRKDDLRRVGAVGGFSVGHGFVPSDRDYLIMRIKKAQHKIDKIKVNEHNLQEVENMLKVVYQ